MLAWASAVGNAVPGGETKGGSVIAERLALCKTSFLPIMLTHVLRYHLPWSKRENTLGSTTTLSRSRRILSGRGEDESLSRARGVMTLFDRVWNGMHQLSEHHPSRKQLLQAFFDEFTAYTDECGELSMTVDAYALSMDGQPLLKVERKKSNFVNRLFHNGIRRLVLHPGLQEAEVLRFIEVLRTDFTKPQFLEDDVVTLLWEAGLQAISYSAFDIFDDDTATQEDTREVPEIDLPAPGAAPPGTGLDTAISGKLLDADEIMARAVSALQVTGAMADTSHLPNHPHVISASDKLLQELAGQPLADLEEAETDQRGFTPRQAQALRRRLRAAEAALAPKFGEIVLTTLRGLPDTASEQVLQGFRTFAHTSLGLEAEAALARALRAMAPLRQTPEGTLAYKRLLATLLEPDVMARLLSRLEAPQPAPGLLDLLHILGQDGFSTLWQHLLTLTHATARQHLLALLGRYAASHAPLLLAQVATGHAEAALQALAVLKQLPLPDIVKDLLVGLHHAATAVRLEVVNMVQQADDPAVRDMLLAMVHDKAEQVRLAVIQILLSRQCAALEEALMTAMRTPDFIRRSAEEKRRTLSSLGRVATVKGLAMLRDVAVASARHPGPVDQSMQIAAIRALASRSDLESLPDLQKLARKWFGDRELKRTARSAVAVITRQGETS
jgi:hypothetical protein